MARANNMARPHDTLREYIEQSEKRVVIDGFFNVRMSSEIAENFDAGIYDFMLEEHKKCILELTNMAIKYPSNAKPVFYLYIVPDENFVELLSYPYTTRDGGGKPVGCYDIDGFNSAYGSSQNRLVCNEQISITRHINLVHEYAHLIQDRFGFKAQMFCEGFAELVPWYALEYEKLVPSHLEAMKALEKIYTANELLEFVEFNDVVKGQTCSFQPSYISSYLWVRAVVEHIRSRFNLSRFEAIQKFLEFYTFSRYNKQWFIMELADMVGMNAGKLLDSNEYQVKELDKIKKGM